MTVYTGLDVSDRTTHICAVDEQVDRARIAGHPGQLVGVAEDGSYHEYIASDAAQENEPAFLMEGVASPLVLDTDRGKQIAVLLNGQGNAMPAWKHLSDTEIAAVITFTKNHWSNKTGQLVQPAEVLAARK